MIKPIGRYLISRGGICTRRADVFFFVRAAQLEEAQNWFGIFLSTDNVILETVCRVKGSQNHRFPYPDW